MMSPDVKNDIANIKCTMVDFFKIDSMSAMVMLVVYTFVVPKRKLLFKFTVSCEKFRRLVFSCLFFS
jgi:hypothetical protein